MNVPQPNKRVLAQDIELKNTSPVACEKCNGEAFQQALMLRRVSALLTGEKQDGFLPIQVFSCTVCGHVNEHFLPEEIRPVKLVA